MFEVQDYTTEDGRDPVKRWLDKLRDPKARERILMKIRRLEQGMPGDSKSVNGAIRELRIHYGSGYRLYFARIEQKVILLLCGGSKKTQPNDIATAKERFRD